MLIQMVYTSYVKLHILHHHFQGHRPYTIARVLEEEGVKSFMIWCAQVCTALQRNRIDRKEGRIRSAVGGHHNSERAGQSTNGERR